MSFHFLFHITFSDFDKITLLEDLPFLIWKNKQLLEKSFHRLTWTNVNDFSHSISSSYICCIAFNEVLCLQAVRAFPCPQYHETPKYCSASHSIRNYIRRLLVSKGVSAAEWWPHSLKIVTLYQRSKVSEELSLGLDETTVKIPVACALSWSLYQQLLNFSFDFDLILIIFSSLQQAIVMNLQQGQEKNVGAGKCMYF